MKKKFIGALFGLVTITMLTLNFSVLSNSKTGDTILDLVSVSQANAESGGCIAYGDFYQKDWCTWCCNSSCGEYCTNIC